MAPTVLDRPPVRALTPGRRRPPSAGPALAVIVALGAVLRFATLDAQSLWLDEATTIRLLRLSFADMLEAVSDGEVTPPLYYAAAWGWAQVFGLGEVGLRSLSALAGTLAVPVSYAVARELAPRRVALVVAALAATSPLLVWYAQEGRSYALFALLGWLSLLFALRAHRSPSAGNLAGWAVASGLCLLTHYFALFLVAPAAVWLLISARRRGPVLAAILVTVLAGLAILPVALAQQAGPGVDWISRHPLGLRLNLVVKKFLTGETGFLIPGVQWLALGLVLAALALAVTRTGPVERAAAGRGVALCLVLAIPPLALALLDLDYLLARNLILAWLPAAVVAGAGLGAARAGALGLGLAAVLCVLSAGIVVATAVDRDLGREDWRGLAAALGPRADGRLVAVQPPHELRSLETYLPTRPAPAAIRADRLTVVQTTRAGPQPQPPAPRGWTFVGRREVQRLSVVEYRRPAGPREPAAGPPELPGATVRLAP